MEKKKRGRKPKNNIVLNDNHEVNNDHKINNLIICLKEKTTPKEINGVDVKPYDNIEMMEEVTENMNKPSICWNCCHDFDHQTYYIIDDFVNKNYHIFGNFCSYECSCRYLFDNYQGSELWKKYSLLSMYYDNNSKELKIAPSRFSLKKFGGNLEIDEYRNNFTSNVNDHRILPIIPMNITFYMYDNNIKNNISQELKLYRKNPIENKNNIFNTMNINKFD
jgi:hypothetical protein